ncbi:MAG: hypothetical protein ABIC04_02725, partial [Nanoarchaeota archaeon]
MLKRKTKKIKEYADARKALKQHDHKILGLHPLINGSSVELKDGEWRLNIFAIAKHLSFRFFEKIEVDGMPVKVKVVGEITSVAYRTEKQRPAPGGVSVGHYLITAGTIGTVIYQANEPAKAYILSNNHVLANSNVANIGDPILQPGPHDGGELVTDQIATLTDFEPLDFIGGINYIDAAIAQADSYDDLSMEIYEITNWIGAIEDAVVSQTVEKSGRTSAITEGTITEFSGEIVVNYNIGIAIFDDQIVTGPILSPGDSGSLLINKATGKAVGLGFAAGGGLAVHNRMTLIVDRFNLKFFPDRVETSIKGLYDIISTEKYLKGNYNIDQWEKELKARYYIKGTNSEIDPYPVTDIYQLQHIGDVGEYPATYYRLNGTIEAAETLTWNNRAGFIPLIINSYIHFNGNYNEIRDLYVNRPEEDYGGLFGNLPYSPGRIIKNVWLRDIIITAKNYVGGLCANTRGRTITNCHFSGTITGIDEVGGICGELYYGELRRCSSIGNIYGKSKVGGLIGNAITTSFYDSYASANVFEHPDYIGLTNYHGGLVGNPSMLVQHCYADGLVEKTTGTVGGLSYNAPTADNHNYWDTEKTGQATSGAGEGKTTVNMRKQATFVEWDFVNTWYIIETVTAPLLRQDYWLLEHQEDSEATDTFFAVKLTDHMQEYAEATLLQEFVSLTDIMPGISEATDDWHNQVNISTSLPAICEATDVHEANVIAGRNFDSTSDATDEFEAVNWSKWLIENKYYSKQYTFVLTGYQDNLSDLTLPISSCQGRLRTDAETYIAVTLPAESDTITGINLRPNGEIVVSMQFVFRGETIYDQEIGRVDLEDIRIDEGSVNRSITLSGHSTYSYFQQIVNLSNPMIR